MALGQRGISWGMPRVLGLLQAMNHGGFSQPLHPSFCFRGTDYATEGSGDSCENADEGLDCVRVAVTHLCIKREGGTQGCHRANRVQELAWKASHIVSITTVSHRTRMRAYLETT